MSRPKRILIYLGIVVTVGGFYLWFFGEQTVSAIVVRYGSRKIPGLSKAPAPLPDLTVSPVPHKRLSYFGYEFELPWDDVDEQKDKMYAQKDKTFNTVHVTFFRSGNAFWFSTFPSKNFINELMKDARLNPQKFVQRFGQEAFESNYNFNRLLLQATPSQVTPFVSRNRATQLQYLVMIKAMSIPNAGSGIFDIETDGFQGFQFENPARRPPRITVYLYSDTGGVDLIFLQKIDGTAPAISQAEINRVIQSLHKVPATTLASTEAAK